MVIGDQSRLAFLKKVVTFRKVCATRKNTEHINLWFRSDSCSPWLSTVSNEMALYIHLLLSLSILANLMTSFYILYYFKVDKIIYLIFLIDCGITSLSNSLTLAIFLVKPFETFKGFDVFLCSCLAGSVFILPITFTSKNLLASYIR